MSSPISATAKRQTDPIDTNKLQHFSAFTETTTRARTWPFPRFCKTVSEWLNVCRLCVTFTSVVLRTRPAYIYKSQSGVQQQRASTCDKFKKVHVQCVRVRVFVHDLFETCRMRSERANALQSIPSASAEHVSNRMWARGCITHAEHTHKPVCIACTSINSECDK